MKSGIRKTRVIPLDVIQRHVNMVCASLDLFGGEDSSNAANFFGAGLKGRDREMAKYDEHTALGQTYRITRPTSDGQLIDEDIPLRRAMNEVLRDAYVEDCQKVVESWNRILRKEGCDVTITLPHRRFYRHQGFTPGFILTPMVTTDPNPMA